MTAPDRVRPSFVSLVMSDLESMVEPRQGQPRARWAVEVVVRWLVVPRVRAVVLFRLSQVAARRRLAPLALMLQGRALRGSGAEISPSADIGPGLCLVHSAGIVVGPDVVLGRGARIYQGVTLGDGRIPGQPTIGDHATLGAGSCVLGGVTIGNRVVVGAGVRVTGDLQDDTVATNMQGPAQRRRRGVDPRLDGLAGWG